MPQGVGVQVPPSAPFFKVISILCAFGACRSTLCFLSRTIVFGRRVLITKCQAWWGAVDRAELLRSANLRSVWLQQCGPVWSSSGQALAKLWPSSDLAWSGIRLSTSVTGSGSLLQATRLSELASGSWKRPNPLVERAYFRRFTPAKPRSPLDTFGPTQYRAPIVRLGVSSRRCMAV